jgi:mxaJ protein
MYSAFLSALLLMLIVGCGSSDQLAAKRVLRVCSDPNNLPFSNEREEGFENKIAEIIANDMHADLSYYWFAQRRGFIRNTLSACNCDVVMGLPASLEMALTTAPYYRSSYVFLSMRERHHNIASFDDPQLRKLRVGINLIGDDGANTPPAHALTRRGIINNVRGYTIYGVYSKPNPASQIIGALLADSIDVAIVWGPLAGYFAGRSEVPLTIQPVAQEIEQPYLQFVYDIAMGVRRTDVELKDELDSIISRRRTSIDSILEAYHIPRKDKQDHFAQEVTR